MPQKSNLPSGIIRLQRVSSCKTEQARALRRNMTHAEKVLWHHIRKEQVQGFRFRKQQVIDGFIVDFFCPNKYLVLEIDGTIHDTTKQKSLDQHRTKVFEARGLRVLRFRNEEVLGDILSVIERIRSF